ncbi:hypothetical protein TEA_013727 [Camellia sinensis var. sinensis]|uniref:histone deacetylase n=1 Tax=Camellia sinensis var. sinensis TaxID=542762 RepID=A0A4V3WL66_CAMSN|nr:hypothetical protein TEA_013727 [Camellia sinensis var. sinensis]
MMKLIFETKTRKPELRKSAFRMKNTELNLRNENHKMERTNCSSGLLISALSTLLFPEFRRQTQPQQQLWENSGGGDGGSGGEIFLTRFDLKYTQSSPSVFLQLKCDPRTESPTSMTRPHKAYPVELAQFHSADYVEFLHRITPDTQHLFSNELARYNLGEDCPVFENLFEFCQIYAGGTIDAARRLNNRLCDIAINWAGGLHHAKKCEASGFCYINDLVLGILELLKYHPRVLYIDIDVHHGDGSNVLPTVVVKVPTSGCAQTIIELPIYASPSTNNVYLYDYQAVQGCGGNGVGNLVMTVSFHKYGDLFFPGTGDVKEIGQREGKFYAINVPLKDGIDDTSFTRLFKAIIAKVVETYLPGVIVLQCGADSLAGDRLGCFNLSIDGHAECVKFVKKFNLPLLVTGGGGYTKENVARCWTFETGVLLDSELPNEIPENEYVKYFAPDFSLRIPNGHIENLNSKSYLSMIKTQVLENLRCIQHAPSVQLQEVPPDFYIPDFDEDEQNPDERVDQHTQDKQIQRDDEYYEGDNDNDHNMDDV